MISKNITQNLDWIDNDPNSNPVVNETTSITFRFMGIKLFTKNLQVTHTGKYSLKKSAGTSRPKGEAPVVKGFH